MDKTKTTSDKLFIGTVVDWNKSQTNDDCKCERDCGCEYGDNSECCTHRGIVPVDWLITKTKE